MLLGRTNSKPTPDFLRTSSRRGSRRTERNSNHSAPTDSFVRSSRSSSSSPQKTSLGKTVLLTAVGAAIGTGLAALSLPIAGALLVGGGIGAIAGAAVGQGALSESGGSYDPKKSNPYTDPFHPDSPLNPNNPNNPIFWAD